jgi:hypothetical protein
MAIIPFCTFLPVLKKTVTQRNQEQIRSPKPSSNHGRRIKTILGQFRNKHGRYKTNRQQRNLADYFSCQKVGVVKCIPQELQSPSTDNRHLIDLLTPISAPHFGHFAKSFANIIRSQLLSLDMNI